MGSKLGAQAAANILGIHVDTLRKRAKAKKIPGKFVGGKWEFDEDEITGKRAAPPAPFVPGTRTKNVTDVVFVLDRSSSMGGLESSVRSNLDSYVEELRRAAGANDEYFVSVVSFGSDVQVHSRGEPLAGLVASRYYSHVSGMTALRDAISTAISICQDRDDGKRAFLVYTLTDGQENNSKVGHDELVRKIRSMTATDRYTFAAAGPLHSRAYMEAYGMAPGNVTEWETSLKGSQHLGGQTITALSSYASSRSVGVTNSVSFYANVSGPADQFAQKLDQKLQDVTDQIEVRRVTDKDPLVIRKFCEKNFGNYPKGHIAYQLTKPEKVQDYKQILIQDTATGKFYRGWEAAKKLLGIPDFAGTVKIKPGSLGEFKPFVQSTSENRKLVPGTTVVKFP